ncbi:MAG TPA: hypothetical protein VFN68_09405, partial [Acidimicrobiales bacterium]|nr:hypothetical protein [Acidimicrobiales bacterium]
MRRYLVRRRPSRDVVILRAGPAAAACVAAAVLIAGRPVPAVAVLGALAATGAVAAAVAPQWPWPTVTLALLA